MSQWATDRWAAIPPGPRTASDSVGQVTQVPRPVSVPSRRGDSNPRPPLYESHPERYGRSRACTESGSAIGSSTVCVFRSCPPVVDLPYPSGTWTKPVGPPPRLTLPVISGSPGLPPIRLKQRSVPASSSASSAGLLFGVVAQTPASARTRAGLRRHAPRFSRVPAPRRRACRDGPRRPPPPARTR